MKKKNKDTETVRSVYSKKKYTNDIFFMPSSNRSKYNRYPDLHVLCDELSACNTDDYDDLRQVVQGHKK